MRRWWSRIGVALVLCLSTLPALAAGKCATGRGHLGLSRAAPLPPVARHAAYRTAAPVSVAGARALYTDYFRILWGNDYDASDPEWADPDGDQIPLWVEELAAALEAARTAYAALGYPDPYGADTYYIDAYVGNTGVVVEGQSQIISSSYYAYTEIDRDYRVAYFVFNDDFSRYADDELAVLRATAAHELFHAVQRAMGYPWDAEGPGDGDEYISDARWLEEGWWLEATATWMEEVVLPEVDDYVSYVHDFLAEPELALTSMDGLREYGAAIFPGYLWGRYRGGELIHTVFSTAYELTLEPALRAALTVQGAPALEEVVADFWGRAARPSVDTWDDAVLYRKTDIPDLLETVSGLPATVVPGAYRQPQRFGANLVRVKNTVLPAPFGMAWTEADTAWRVAVWEPGAVAAEVFTPEVGSPRTLGQGDGDWTYLALVNVTAEAGAQGYAAEIGDDGVVEDWQLREGEDPDADAGESSGGGGGGGCFLRALHPGR